MPRSHDTSGPGAVAAAGGGALVVGAAGFCAGFFGPNVLELRVESCGPPLSLKQEVFDHWHQRIAAASWAAVRPRWKEGFEATAAADPGVVLGVAVTRSTGVYENRKPWNRGTLEGGQPWWVRDRYFARGTCADWPVGTTGVFDAAGDPRPSAAWPPDVLPSLLNLQVLTPSGPDRAALLR